jgi:hypothetical protein
MQAVIAKIISGEEIESCAVAGCTRTAAYHLVKMRDDNSEEEAFFCAEHGEEYAERGRLAISNNV